MLYRYLFDKHATGSFDWARLWAHVNLAPEDTLSSSFLQQTESICMGSNLEDMLHLNTIGQLAEYLRDLHLEVGPLQDQLELVYRWRGSSNARPRRIRKAAVKNDTSSRGTAKGSEDVSLQAAIEASLKDRAGSPEAPIILEEEPLTKSSVDDSGMFIDDPAQGVLEVEDALKLEARQSTTPPPAATATATVTATKTSPATMQDGPSKTDKSPSSTPMDIWDIANKAEVVRGQEEGSIIGTEKFVYKEEEMMEYVQNTLAFWNGRVGRFFPEILIYSIAYILY